MINLLVFNPAPHINAMHTILNTIENEDPYFVGFVFGVLCTALVIALTQLLFWILDRNE